MTPLLLPTRDATHDSDPWWMRRAAWLYGCLLDGNLPDRIGSETLSYPVRLESLGQVSLPGGELVVGDPYTMEDEVQAFTRRMAADTAGAVVARAYRADDHRRVAAVVLTCGTGEITSWAMGVTGPDQDVESLTGDDFFGFPVDAGMAAFGSPDAVAAVASVMLEDAGMLEDPVSRALFADGVGTSSAVRVAPAEDAEPVIACSAGWGDGVYPVWFGQDDTGATIVAVCDFLLTQDGGSTD